jgi:hypothetical protein
MKGSVHTVGAQTRNAHFLKPTLPAQWISLQLRIQQPTMIYSITINFSYNVLSSMSVMYEKWYLYINVPLSYTHLTWSPLHFILTCCIHHSFTFASSLYQHWQYSSFLQSQQPQSPYQGPVLYSENGVSVHSCMTARIYTVKIARFLANITWALALSHFKWTAVLCFTWPSSSPGFMKWSPKVGVTGDLMSLSL